MLAVALVAAIVYFSLNAGGDSQTSAVETGPEELQFLQLQSDAFAKITQGDFENAKSDLEKAMELVQSHESLTQYKSSTQKNLAMINDRLSGAGVKEAPISNSNVTEISDGDLRKYYPIGKTIQSSAILDIQGKGRSEFFCFQGEGNFAYEYQLDIESKVLGNDGSQMQVELFFKNASEIMVDSQQEFSWRDLDAPILEAVWGGAEMLAKKYYPPYGKIKIAVKLLDNLLGIQDKLFAQFPKLLQMVGEEAMSQELPLDLSSEIKELTGCKLVIDYHRERGVLKVKATDGAPQKVELLEQLGRSYSPVSDYVIGKSTTTKIGENIDFNSYDIARMVVVDYDLDSDGTITVQRKKDADNQVQLAVVGGEVQISMRDNESVKTGTVRPTSGTIQFDPESLMVSKARIRWNATLDWVKSSHPLFGIKQTRDVRVTSLYEAREVKSVEKAESADNKK